MKLGIKYNNLESLFSSYPIGLPQVIIPNDINVLWTEPNDIPHKGLLKVRILPPKNLLLPVLPIRIDQRLLFCLCHRCAKEFEKKNTKLNHKCAHSDEEREFTATVTSLELELALKEKYIVKKFYRAWHYNNFSDYLFKHYVR